jgi:very-short-patch-repair endonuclease
MEQDNATSLRESLHVRNREKAVIEFGRDAMVQGLATGVLEELGDDWYGTHETPESTRLALRCGMRETCMSALEHHGVWIPPFEGIHLTCPRGRVTSAAKRILQDWERPFDREESLSSSGEGDSRAPVVLHPGLRAWPDDEPVVPVLVALAHAGRCVGPLEALIVFESVLREKKASKDALVQVQAGLPQRVRNAKGPIRRSAGSGTETKVRRALELEQVDVTPQWHIDGVGFVDLLVGERLVIECDSRAHHTGRTAYQRDRLRDQVLTSLGYIHVRLTWEQVFLEWERTLAYLRGLIAAGLHRFPRRRRLGRAGGHWDALTGLQEQERKEASDKERDREPERDEDQKDGRGLTQSSASQSARG